MSTTDHLQGLNKQQIEAVTHVQGPLLIIAGAGTGKTTVITQRIAWLIVQGLAKPEEILALTFTDKAAGEMEERVDMLLPIGYVNIWISTFHAFGERILKDYAIDIGLPGDFHLLSVSEQWMLVHNNLDRFNLDYYRPLGNPTKFIHALIKHFSRAKDELISPEEYLKYVEDLQLNTDIDVPGISRMTRMSSTTNDANNSSNSRGEAYSENSQEVARLREVADAYHIYQQLLLENNALDFGDLINYTLKLLRERPRILKQLREKFKYILVDEFQDTNYAQYELMKLLSAPQNNITVVGDDDQAIYKFRGASISNILEFKQDYPDCREIFLTENYRSGQKILDTAYQFIQLNNPYRLEVKLAKDNKKQISKKLIAAKKEPGTVECLAYQTAQDEAEGVIKKIIELHGQREAAWSDFAILARANSSAPIFIKILQQHKIPFEYVANRGLYSEPIILEILNYLRLLDNHHYSDGLYRVLTHEPFILPTEDMVKLANYVKQKTVPLYEALKQAQSLLLSQTGLDIIAKFQELFDKHAASALKHSAAEIYVWVVRDLGIEQRVCHPALAQEAQYLASFYERIQRFELDNEDHCLHSFLSYMDLELESGEEGQFPANFEQGPDTIKIITIHSAKGLEWPYVFVVHLVDRRFPSVERRESIELPKALIKEILPEGDVHLQEERRLFYVAMTRAKNTLYLTRAKDYFGKTTKKPSRFLYELGFVEKEEISCGVRPRTVAGSDPANIAKKPTLRAPGTLSVGNKSHYPLPDSFSFTSISAFKKCPLEYKFRHLLKLPAPGSASMSFGITMHKTLEEFLKLWTARTRGAQPDLFGNSTGAKINLPTLDELHEIYEHCWIDDWYDNPSQKKDYHTLRGPEQLKNFYEHFIVTRPKPKYLEEFFKIAIGPYKFVGKIDRIDQQEQGNVIIDYKTGQTSPDKLEKVDRDQLIIYQIAAEEFWRESITSATYWYLGPNQFSKPFLATDKQKEKVIQDYTATIDYIMQTIKDDSFLEADRSAGQHECKYQ